MKRTRLDQEFDRVGGLLLQARTLVQGLYQGRHASPAHGGSTEFYDYQMYTPGDSLSRVDWRVFGRTDRLYVRRFQHFGELTLHLIVDCSGSMDYAQPGATVQMTKWALAQRIAAALAFLAVRQSERVALGLVGEHIERSLPAGGSWRHLMHVVNALEETEPRGETDLPTGLEEAQALVPMRRLVMIVSDCLCDARELLDAVQQLRYFGNDVSCIQVLTRSEIDLTGMADHGLFVDAENAQRSVRTNPGEVRAAYGQRMRDHIEMLRRGMAAAGATFHPLTTETHPIEALRGVLDARLRAGQLLR